METIDYLYSETIKLIQAKDGYRFSLDPVLLADFVTLRKGERILDLGTGCGVLSLLLARRDSDARIVGWERQPQMVDRACRGVELSGMAGRISIVEADLRGYRDLAVAGSFGLVISNPPYRTLDSGRIAPTEERAAARHEMAGGLNDFLSAASWCLKNGGRFALIYLAERLSELLVKMTSVGIEPKRLRLIHASYAESAKMVMVEGRKGGAVGLKVESPLHVYNCKTSGVNRDYTDEVLRMYGKKKLGAGGHREELGGRIR